jgi:hypothetical protein
MISRGSEDKRSQSDKFRDLAHELECDEDEEAFKAKLRKVAKAKPPKPKDEGRRER